MGALAWRRIRLAVGCIVCAGVMLAGLGASAAIDVTVKQLRSDPEGFFNLSLRVRGVVEEVATTGDRPGYGSYTLVDKLGGTIEVRGIKLRDLPLRGQEKTVVGKIYTDADSGAIFLMPREAMARWVTWTIPAVVVFLVLCVVLVRLLITPVQARAGAETGAAAARGRPAVETQDEPGYRFAQPAGQKKSEETKDFFGRLQVLEGGEDAGRTFDIVGLDLEEKTIARPDPQFTGRQPDIQLNSSSVSRIRHAKLMWDGSNVVVVADSLDKKGASGVSPAKPVYVMRDGAETTLTTPQNMPLQEGDIIRVGGVKLRFNKA
jgi:hypothetical protein